MDRDFKRALCRVCEERVPHTRLTDPDEWRCENCGHRRPARPFKRRNRKPGKTASQEAAIERIKRQVLVAHAGEAHVDGYEVKEFTVEDFGWFVSLVVEVGLKGDEGTMASVFARTRRHIAIGRNGGVKLLNPKRKAEAQGWFNVLHGLTA